MPPPLAIVTGASSGIGLALSKHLLGKGWKVVMADLNPPDLESAEARALFQRTDVSDWDSMKALFKAAWDWGGRIDFHAANAGIDDRDSFFKTYPDLDEPPKPNLKTMEVDVFGPIYGIQLFAHYARKHKQTGGKIVVTSSMAGIYKFETNPQYCAAKHALIGLTRALGANFEKEGMTINAILPAFVATNLAPEGLVETMPQEHLTPMSTILKAYDTFLENSDLSGETVEVSQDQLFFRKQVEYPNESQRWVSETDFWSLMYANKAKVNGS